MKIFRNFFLIFLLASAPGLQAKGGAEAVRFVAYLHSFLEKPGDGHFYLDTDKYVSHPIHHQLAAFANSIKRSVREDASYENPLPNLRHLKKVGLEGENREVVKEYTEWLNKIETLLLKKSESQKQKTRREPFAPLPPTRKVGDPQAKIRHLQSELALIKFAAKAAVEKLTKLQEENEQLKRELERTRKRR